MTEILKMINDKYDLLHINNMVYSYLGTHPVAQLIKDKEKESEDWFKSLCNECGMHGAEEDYDGMCEYCYAENMGELVYKCDDCNAKGFEYGGYFENTDDGLFCNACYSGWLEVQNEEVEEVEEE